MLSGSIKSAIDLSPLAAEQILSGSVRAAVLEDAIALLSAVLKYSFDHCDDPQDQPDQQVEPDKPVERRTVKFYRHTFMDGECHLLPDGTDYTGPEWAAWRANPANSWHYRELEVDADGCRTLDAKGRPVRPGPWLNPDGTKKPKDVDMTAAFKSRRPSKRQKAAMAEWNAARGGGHEQR
jgi:hypothetical protein